MKDIFANLYSKVLSFFQTEKGENTRDIAANRLKLVLMHDRTKLDQLTMEKMRSELINVISKYVVIDQELLELNLAGEGNSIALMLNIPVVRAKTEEELAELAEAEEAAKKAAGDDSDEIVDEESDNESEEEPEEVSEQDDDETDDETENSDESTDEPTNELSDETLDEILDEPSDDAQKPKRKKTN